MTYFACYRCPGGEDNCTYLGPDIPAETCPKHGREAIYGVTGRHYEACTPGVSSNLGYLHPDDEPVQPDLFGGAA